MTIEDFIKKHTKQFHLEVYELADALRNNIEALDEISFEQKEQLEDARSRLSKSTALITKQADTITSLIKEDSPIDFWCSKNYKKINNIAYQNKRGDNEMIVYLNEFITPNAFEVLNILHRFRSISNEYNKLSSIANYVAKNTNWVDELKLYESGDFYYYPNETLTTQSREVDCDDVSFCMASFNAKRMGVCFGFYLEGEEKIGHAFPVFLDVDDKPYILETTGKTAAIIKYDSAQYIPHFIITKDNTYQVREGVQFGVISHYD